MRDSSWGYAVGAAVEGPVQKSHKIKSRIKGEKKKKLTLDMNVLMLKNLEIDLCNLIFCCGAYALFGGNKNRIENAQLEPKKTSSNGSMCFFFGCV